MHYSHPKTTRGSLTLEILLALFILTNTLTGATLLTLGGQENALDGTASVSALLQHRAAFETLFSDLRAHILHTPMTVDPEDYSEKYISPCAKEISLQSVWNTSHGTTSISSTALVGSAREAQKLSAPCDPFPPHDAWEQSHEISSLLPNSATGTDIALTIREDVLYAFISATSASSSDPDVFIFSLTDSINPLLVSSPNINAGIKSISIAGKYAYILQNANRDQLQVLDLSDITHPTIIASRSLPNISYTCTQTTETCRSGRSMFYYDGRIYVGTGYLAFGATPAYNNEFHIFCVDDTSIPDCAPGNPVWLGSLNVNHVINDIVVQGTYAYLATSDDTGELLMVDIGNPTSLKHPDGTGTKFDAQTDTGGASAEDGKSVFVLGSTVYLGRGRVSSNTKRNFYILDTSDPSAITVHASYRLPLARAADYVSDIITQGDVIFVSTTDDTRPLSTLRAGETGVTEDTSCASATHQKIQRIAYMGDHLYAAGQTGPLLRSFTSTDSCI